jgi:hypothetical protein
MLVFRAVGAFLLVDLLRRRFTGLRRRLLIEGPWGGSFRDRGRWGCASGRFGTGQQRPHGLQLPLKLFGRRRSRSLRQPTGGRGEPDLNFRLLGFDGQGYLRFQHFGFLGCLGCLGCHRCSNPRRIAWVRSGPGILFLLSCSGERYYLRNFRARPHRRQLPFQLLGQFGGGAFRRFAGGPDSRYLLFQATRCRGIGFLRRLAEQPGGLHLSH